MSLPWSGQQIEWLQAMGLDVLRRPAADVTRPVDSASTDTTVSGIPAALSRAARGADLAVLLEAAGVPRDAASRRAFWRLLRPHRKAARRG